MEKFNENAKQVLLAIQSIDRLNQMKVDIKKSLSLNLKALSGQLDNKELTVLKLRYCNELSYMNVVKKMKLKKYHDYARELHFRSLEILKDLAGPLIDESL